MVCEYYESYMRGAKCPAVRYDAALQHIFDVVNFVRHAQ